MQIILPWQFQQSELDILEFDLDRGDVGESCLFTSTKKVVLAFLQDAYAQCGRTY